MESNWDEDDIARAIAASLQDIGSSHEATGSSNQPITIDDSDDDDIVEILDARTAASPKTEVVPIPVKPDPEPQVPTPQPTSSLQSTNIPAAQSSFLSERAKLEQARLERLKRLRPDTVSPQPTPSKRAKSSPPSSETESEEDAPPPPKSYDKGKARAGLQPALSKEGELFWQGEVRQTANALVEPAKDKRPLFRITEIIGDKSQVAFAIIATYVIDWAWAYSLFDPNTPVICVTQPDLSGNASVKEVLPNWIKITPFLRLGRGCQHMKFMLLFYRSGRLRVVINTGNLIPYDWREIENTSWVQDLQRRPHPVNPDKSANDFGTQFERVLRSLNVEAGLRTFDINGTELRLSNLGALRANWDFSPVKVKLVASVAGKHEGWPDVIRTGHPRLMKAVREIGFSLPPGQTLNVECQGSSIGTYSTQWINEFVDSCRGLSAETWLDLPKSRRMKLPYPKGLKILFPSLQTVRASRLGEDGGGTMFCRRQQWEGAKFPRELFHDSNSKRGKVLMHSKMIIATLGTSSKETLDFPGTKDKSKGKQRRRTNDHDSDIEDEAGISDVEEVAGPQLHGWAYVGSHNFTSSAWGTLSGSAFSPTLNLSNFEIGIIFPLRDEEHANEVACYERPPRKYNTKVDVPWFQHESEVIKASNEEDME